MKKPISQLKNPVKVHWQVLFPTLTLLLLYFWRINLGAMDMFVCICASLLLGFFIFISCILYVKKHDPYLKTAKMKWIFAGGFFMLIAVFILGTFVIMPALLMASVRHTGIETTATIKSYYLTREVGSIKRPRLIAAKTTGNDTTLTLNVAYAGHESKIAVYGNEYDYLQIKLYEAAKNSYQLRVMYHPFFKSIVYTYTQLGRKQPSVINPTSGKSQPATTLTDPMPSNVDCEAFKSNQPDVIMRPGYYCSN